MPVDTGTELTRLGELGHFVRSRRERLSPEALGLPNGFRRRTPGLRREEVAQLAGVGLTWYTWLEQGRDINVSAETLCSIARALHMDPAERAHLLRLAGHSAPLGFAEEGVRAEHRRVLERWDPHPAHIINRRWDVLAMNRASDVVFDGTEYPAGLRNVLWGMFLIPSRRSLCPNWREAAARMVATFRSEAAEHLEDPEFRVLIAELVSESPDFAELWEQRNVLQRTHGIKRVRHPALGDLEFEHTDFDIADQPGCKLILYLPRDQRTAAMLAGLELSRTKAPS